MCSHIPKIGRNAPVTLRYSDHECRRSILLVNLSLWNCFFPVLRTLTWRSTLLLVTTTSESRVGQYSQVLNSPGCSRDIGAELGVDRSCPGLTRSHWHGTVTVALTPRGISSSPQRPSRSP
jgi:hypothetical protein